MGRRPGWSVQSWGEGSSAPKPVRINERKLESEVSNLIGNMPFTWLPVLDEPGPTSARRDIERGSIALLSNWAKEVLDAPTGEWLGLHCPREKVRGSGLWNQNHVDERYDPSFLDLFERLLEKDGRESRASVPRDTGAPSPLVPAPPARAPSGGNAARIIALLRETPNLDDDQISVKLGITPRQQVNQICRRLERTGVLARGRGTHGKIVNRLIGGGEGRSPVRPPEPVGPPVAPLTSRLVTSATGGSVLASTLLLIPCSARKKRVTGRNASGPSILDQLSPELALELSVARDEVRERAAVDESTKIPAWERYDGTLYQAAAPVLGGAVQADIPVAILSGGYGVVLATEPIGDYEAVFKSSWWPRGLLERVLAEYAQAIGARTVRAFLSSSTGYSSVVRRVRWRTGIHEATLHCPQVRGGGAMVKAPRAQGEALAAVLSGQLIDGWLSSDGVGLSSEWLV